MICSFSKISLNFYLQQEKHFFVSGHILHQSLSVGHLVESDVTDVSMAIEQQAGLFLRSYSNMSNMNKIYEFIKYICLDADSTLQKTQYLSEMPTKV